VVVEEESGRRVKTNYINYIQLPKTLKSGEEF
jgi:hypothetical protein